QRVPEAAAPAVAPIAVVEAHYPQHGQGRSCYRRHWVARIQHRRDIRRRVIHVVLNTVPVYDLHFDDVFFSYTDVGGRVHATAPDVSAKVERCGAIEIIPGDVAAYA